MKWTARDSEEAMIEGWDVFDADYYGLEIERIDTPEDGSRPAFANDVEAVRFVEARAAAGSELHAKALAIHREHDA
jgi:hypothetical protein